MQRHHVQREDPSRVQVRARGTTLDTLDGWTERQGRAVKRIETSERGSMREAMPAVTAFVDNLRAAFGAEYINGAIRQGLRGRPVFWASEGGHELGTRPPGMARDDEEGRR